MAAVLDLTTYKSPAQWLRSQVRVGLKWRAGPGFLRASLTHLDKHYIDGYGLAQFARYPDRPPQNMAGVVRPLRDFLVNPTHWDGIEITAIAKQIPGTLQVLTEHDITLGEHKGQPVKLASYVFQLHSVDFEQYHTAYVHLQGPHTFGLRPDVPPDWRTWATGVIVAYGAVLTQQGTGANCIYVAARAVYGFPPASRSA